MIRVMITNEFERECKKLVSSNRNQELNSLRTVLIRLANQLPVSKKYKPHHLSDSEFNELHVSSDLLLLYKYDNDETLVMSLKVANMTNHKRLTKDSNRTDYEYKAVPTEYLHEITSSVDLKNNDYEMENLNDFLESISDYSDTGEGYILLNNYFIEGNELHCLYDYYLYDRESMPADSIDYVIDLDKFNIKHFSDLIPYLREFVNEITGIFR